MSEPDDLALVSSNAAPKRRPINSTLIALFAVVLVAAASLAWYAHDQLEKHAAHLKKIEASLSRADANASAYHHLTDLTEHRRRDTNKSLDDLERANRKLQDAAIAGYATVISGYLDEEAGSTHYDDIQSYAEAHLPADEFNKLNITLNPLVKRGAEFSDSARAIAATLRAIVANPFTAMTSMRGKLWTPYDTAQTAEHDAFAKYQDVVYDMQQDADTRRDALRSLLSRVRGESFTEILHDPVEYDLDTGATHPAPARPRPEPSTYTSKPLSRTKQPTTAPSSIHASGNKLTTAPIEPTTPRPKENPFPGPGFEITKCPPDLPDSMGSHPVCATKISDPTAGYKVQPASGNILTTTPTEPATPHTGQDPFPGPGFAISKCPPDLPESMGSHPVCATKISDPTAGYKVRPGTL